MYSHCRRLQAGGRELSEVAQAEAQRVDLISSRTPVSLSDGNCGSQPQRPHGQTSPFRRSMIRRLRASICVEGADVWHRTHCPEPTPMGIVKQTDSDGVAFKQVKRVRGVRNYALPKGPT
jgi:hypothetical protein